MLCPDLCESRQSNTRADFRLIGQTTRILEHILADERRARFIIRIVSVRDPYRSPRTAGPISSVLAKLSDPAMANLGIQPLWTRVLMAFWWRTRELWRRRCRCFRLDIPAARSPGARGESVLAIYHRSMRYNNFLDSCKAGLLDDYDGSRGSCHGVDSVGQKV